MDSYYNLKDQIRKIELKRKNYFNELIEKTDLNLMQLEIMVSLYEFPEQNTFTEIMKSKDYSKSFVSTAINNLVILGYVKKIPQPCNKKVFTLVLENNCEEIIQAYYKCVDSFYADASKGVSDEKIQVFKAVLNEIVINLTKE